MNVKIKKLIVLVLLGCLVFIVFYPNRLNRYVDRRIRAYNAAPKGLLKGVVFQKITFGNSA